MKMDGTTKMQHVSNVSQCVIEGVAKQQQQQHAEEEERVKREEMGNLWSRRRFVPKKKLITVNWYDLSYLVC